MFSNLLPFQAAQSLLERLQRMSSAAPPPDPDFIRPEQPRDAIVSVLPGDVFYIVFALLDPEDLLVCKQFDPAQLCRVLSLLVEVDVRSQYRIELAAAGMVDGGPDGAGTMGERLAALREHRRKWDTPTLSLLASHSWPATPNAVEMVTVDGVPCRCEAQSDERLALSFQPTTDGSVSLQAVVASTHRTHLETADLAQDLMVVSERFGNTLDVKLRLLSARTGLEHPEAAQPVYDITTQLSNAHTVQIYDRYILWKARSAQTNTFTVEIRDWRTSQPIWRHGFPPYVSYNLLDHEHLLVTSQRQEHLEIYHVPRLPTPDPSSSVTPEPTEDTAPLLILELPLGSFRASVNQDPKFRILTSGPSPRAPFRPDPALALTAVRFALYNPELLNPVLLVPGATFRAQIDLAHAAARASDRPASPRPRRVFWHEWGPTGGLMLGAFAHGPTEAVFGTPCGTRLPVLLPERTASRTVVLDLHPWAARRAAAERRAAAASAGWLGRSGAASPAASVPFAAYQGPRIMCPERHFPTMVG
ncbi:uncharacterized protein BXZ73DRAFT_95859 [Epithele typhae]|uniref:uncharacterized protein n=1 Tax=Epithele typhae TaxID=378194 RepID=UPI00200791E7|nr:uncharacterized protein BXZ73DRAFT_95859 [Epithele typhae]KAH9946360.1 hypothetical protein BXZ73DRAFT_95859 [Epithele typhae]